MQSAECIANFNYSKVLLVYKLGKIAHWFLLSFTNTKHFSLFLRLIIIKYLVLKICTVLQHCSLICWCSDVILIGKKESYCLLLQVLNQPWAKLWQGDLSLKLLPFKKILFAYILHEAPHFLGLYEKNFEIFMDFLPWPHLEVRRLRC